MTSHIKISVITPSYNQGQFLEETIQSVLNQNYPNLEYIIIDGGSTDNSVEIIKKYEKNLSYWVSEKDNGQTHAINKGLNHATGEIIGWINSDDLYINKCLFDAVDYFIHHANTDIVFSDYYFIDKGNKIIRRRKEIPFNYNIYLWTGDCYHANCAGFFRRKVFETVGNFDESLQYSMDQEFYLRAAHAGITFGHQRSYWGAYRLHEHSKTVSANDLQKRESIIIIGRFRPPGKSSFSIWWRKKYFKIIRLGWKLFLGSYPRFVLFKRHISIE